MRGCGLAAMTDGFLDLHPAVAQETMQFFKYLRPIVLVAMHIAQMQHEHTAICTQQIAGAQTHELRQAAGLIRNGFE